MAHHTESRVQLPLVMRSDRVFYHHHVPVDFTRIGDVIGNADNGFSGESHMEVMGMFSFRKTTTFLQVVADIIIAKERHPELYHFTLTCFSVNALGYVPHTDFSVFTMAEFASRTPEENMVK